MNNQKNAIRYAIISSSYYVAFQVIANCQVPILLDTVSAIKN